MKPAKIRLYVEDNLGAGQVVSLSREAAHYLFNVMRLGRGDSLRLFNGRDGEWRAEVRDIKKKAGLVEVAENLRPQSGGPDLWLLFAPVKKARMDMIVEKAVELGVAGLWPVVTAHSNSDRVRADRITAQITEAAEQCERLDVPALFGPAPLSKVLEEWPEERVLYFADERGGVAPALGAFSNGPTSSAILIGPEGGFSAAEAEMLREKSFVVPISLGPRVLRAETAALAAITLWQAEAGDWSD